MLREVRLGGCLPVMEPDTPVKEQTEWKKINLISFKFYTPLNYLGSFLTLV